MYSLNNTDECTSNIKKTTYMNLTSTHMLNLPMNPIHEDVHKLLDKEIT